ncbi:MAG TPA: hypothetical protein VG271_02965, partial [Beijerinckiaceae bacterium]|nr:hypothetical protein [Beijerinckiaceae bacterium]
SVGRKDKADGRFLCVLLIVTAASVAPACADDAVSFAGKTITIDVASTAGGGYDFGARAIARYLPKYLPGAPSVVVRNMPGAGGVVLANHLYNVAPKDGTEIGAFESDTAFTPTLNGQPVNFEPAKFGWLGSLDKFVPMVLAWHTKPFQRFDDLKTTKMSVGSTGPGSATSGYPYSLNAFLGTKFDVINGYPGSAEMTLALERGELDGYVGWCWDCLKHEKPQWLTDHSVRVLLQLSFDGDPELTAMGVPTMRDVAKTDEQIKMMQIVLASASFGRPYAAPPRLPAPVLAAWQKAFEGAAHDSQLAADMQAAKSQVRFAGPDGIVKLLVDAASLDAATLDKLRSAYLGKDETP